MVPFAPEYEKSGVPSQEIDVGVSITFLKMWEFYFFNFTYFEVHGLFLLLKKGKGHVVK